MELECPRCHQKTPVPARVCSHCGQPLTSRAAQASSPGGGQSVQWGLTTPPAPPPMSTASTGAITSQRLQFGRKTVITALAGFVGSIIASLILWVMIPWQTLNETSSLRVALTLGVVAGFCVPAAIAAAPDTLQRQFDRARKTGGRAGLIGIAVMVVVGTLIAQFAAPHDVFVGFGGSAVVGALAWVLFGCGLGLVDGVVSRSQQRILLGALGGAIGGLLAYLLMAVMRNEGTFAGVGLLVGLGSGILQDALKQAWIRIVSGANEGTELILDKPRVRLGSSDAADVDLGLYQDQAIAQCHLEIVRQGSEFRLVLLPKATPPVINGSPMAGIHLLRDGDRIQIGHTVLVFHARLQTANP